MVVDAASLWSGVIVGAVLLLLGALGRWLFKSAIRSLTDAVKEQTSSAEVHAAHAASVAEDAKVAATKVATSVGIPNGHGDLITMVTKSLNNQAEITLAHRQMAADLGAVKKVLDDRTELFDGLQLTMEDTQRVVRDHMRSDEAQFQQSSEILAEGQNALLDRLGTIEAVVQREHPGTVRAVRGEAPKKAVKRAAPKKAR